MVYCISMTSKKLSLEQRLYKLPNSIIRRLGVFIFQHPRLGAAVRTVADPIAIMLYSREHKLPETTLPTTNKKRIFVVMTYLGVGGVESVMLNIIKGFDRKEYDIQLITTIAHTNPWHDKFREHVDGIMHVESNDLFGEFQPNAFKRLFLVKYISSNNPHAVLMTNSLLFYHLLPQLRKKTNVPIFDILHTHGTPDQDDAYLKLSMPFDKYITKRIVINEYLKRYYVKKYHVNPEKIIVIYNNIEPIESIGLLDAKQERIFRKHAQKTIITYIGRLELDKSPMRLVKIAKALSKSQTPAVIMVVGDGSQMQKMKNQARTNKTLGKNIEFIGYSDNPYRAMQLSSFTLLVSDMEGLPMSVLESMSIGTPVIASAIGGIPEVIGDCQDGFLVNINQPTEQRIVREFVKSIDNAYELGPAQYASMQKKSISKIKEKFSSMSEDYNKLVS